MDEKYEYPDLNELKEKDGSSDLSYEKLLTTKEWKNFRDRIVQRDNRKCQKCLKKENEKNLNYSWENKNEVGMEYVRLLSDEEAEKSGSYTEHTDVPPYLQVHHKYYIKNKFPWEYRDEAVVSLCFECHEDIHKFAHIMVYENENLVK